MQSTYAYWLKCICETKSPPLSRQWRGLSQGATVPVTRILAVECPHEANAAGLFEADDERGLIVAPIVAPDIYPDDRGLNEVGPTAGLSVTSCCSYGVRLYEDAVKMREMTFEQSGSGLECSVQCIGDVDSRPLDGRLRV